MRPLSLPGGVGVLALAAAGVSCSVGAGVGQARGPLAVDLCGLDDPHYSLDPNFFVGEWNANTFTIRMQRGGGETEYDDELVFLVDDTGYVSQHLNERLPVGPPGAAPVHAVLGLDHSCGRRAVNVHGQNVALEAYAGYIIFSSIYTGTPNAGSGVRDTDATHFSIALRDPRPAADYHPNQPSTSIGPEARRPSRGELDGEFQFYFTRGRPAQRFP